MPFLQPPDDLVREELARILRHGLFPTAPLQQQILQVIVTESLAGRGQTLKEEVIAELVGRKNYDKRKDSSVRGIVGKIRVNLAKYYSAVHDAQIRVEIPKHGFAASFRYMALDSSMNSERETEDHPEGPEPNRTDARASSDDAISPVPFKRRSSAPQLTILTICICAAGALFSFKTTRGDFAQAIVLLALAVILTLITLATTSASTPVRAVAALFFVASMAYFPSAWTIIEMMHSVINLDALPPATLYPFITGLKFVPLFVLVCGFWAGLGVCEDRGFKQHPGLGYLYIALGILFLAMLFMAGWLTDDHNIVFGAVPGTASVEVGYLAALGANLAIWGLGYRFFNQESIRNYHRLFFYCLLTYSVAAIAGSAVDREYNAMNRCCLDKRHPRVYGFAAKELPPTEAASVSADMGTKLRALLQNDSGFRYALLTEPIYKQNFDEDFQNDAVTLGFKGAPLPDGSAVFTIIRFPKRLVETLGLHEMNGDRSEAQ